MDSANEIFAYIIVGTRVRPFDVGSSEDVPDQAIGGVAIRFIEETGLPSGGKVFITEQPEAIPVHLQRRGNIFKVQSTDIVVITPFKIGLPKVQMIEEPLPDGGN